jgi:hypothetical protein
MGNRHQGGQVKKRMLRVVTVILIVARTCSAFATGNGMYDPSMIIREVSDYVTKMKKGPQAWGGLPTARVYEWAMELAISEGHAFGPSYDDSWVRPWLRIDEPTPSLTFWDRQLTYARERFQRVGTCDPQWAPNREFILQSTYTKKGVLERAIQLAEFEANCMSNPACYDDEWLWPVWNDQWHSLLSLELRLDYSSTRARRVGICEPQWILPRPVWGGVSTGDQILFDLKYDLFLLECQQLTEKIACPIQVGT